MSKEEIRNGFNQMIANALAANDHDAVAKLEVCREYFTNSQFKMALQDEVFQRTKARVA